MTEALGTEGLWLLLLGGVLAGLVRGFSGFGTSMIYMPFAAQVLPPVWAMITLFTIDTIGPLIAVPKAARDAYPRDLAFLTVGLILGVPIGVGVLLMLSPDLFRWGVSLVTLGLLAALISGFRYQGPVGRPLLLGTGWLSGVLGGASGLAGPPAILLYMARPLPAATIRANIFIYLLLTDLALVISFFLSGLIVAPAVMTGLLVLPIYLSGIWIGTRVFDPGREKVYRWVAYGIIATSALSGLPIWGL